MWYETIPDVTLGSWLTESVGLFSAVLRAIMEISVLRLFLAVLLWLALVGFLAALVRQGKHNGGKL